jgi:anti-sigma factor ChrR (cupin superfamily)
MLVNADLSAPATVPAGSVDWVASPLPGVERMMLERDGGEVARATSFVRYAPNSRFDAHTHGGGEEYLVLEGTFADEHGRYPAGTYVRNPPGSAHSPAVDDGCIIFVKLRQFDDRDLTPVVVDTTAAAWRPVGQGVAESALHRHGSEQVRMVRLASGAQLALDGGEVLVVEGEVDADGTILQARSWLRRAPGHSLTLAAPKGATLYVKQGHLPAAT